MKTTTLHHGPFTLRNIKFAEFNGVSIDSRDIPKDYIFCALKRQHTDGHLFVKKALENGALAALVDENYAKTADNNEALIIVEDTYRGLIDMASIYASTLKVPILAITGSAGKTSTRSLIADILRQKMQISETPKNFNNHIGVPVSVLKMRERDKFAVLEIGTSGLGEIRDLCKIAIPDYGMITSIAHAHMGGFGSIENVQKAKYELLDAVKKDGILFINNDDPRVAAYPADERKRITYGIENSAEIKFEIINIDHMGRYTLGKNKIEINLQSSGKGAAINAVAAYTFALTIGLDEKDIILAIEKFEAKEGRGKIEKWNDIILIDDSYNANPFSTTNAIHALRDMQCKGKKHMVFGDMLEMGPEAISSHVEIGHECAKADITYLYCLGEDSINTVNTAIKDGIHYAEHFYNKKDVADAVKSKIKPGDIILFKASRGIAIEKVISLIKDL